MYAHMIKPGTSARHKPWVLFILQGVHHLSLYENIFRYCRDFEWFCLSPGLPSDREIEALHTRYGIRFFSDPHACLAHLGQFDALITTWAVPHRKHLPYLKFVALAHDLGLPIYELQHGLFQLGVTYYESAAVIGSRRGAAMTGPGADNLTTHTLKWFGEDGIGYPRSDAFDKIEVAPPPPGSEKITFVTNHHWSILDEDERENCYRVMAGAIRALPAVSFTMLPHSGELKHPAFNAMIANLKEVGATNYHIETSREDGIFDRILANSNLIVASMSTTLLDCELSGVPTVLFFNPSQDELIRGLEAAVTVDTPEALVSIAEDVLYRTYRPQLITGFAEPFRADKLEAKLHGAIGRRRRVSADAASATISRYVDAAA